MKSCVCQRSIQGFYRITLVDPSNYTLAVTEAEDNVDDVVTINPVRLEANMIYVVIAIGTLSDTDTFYFGTRVFDDTGSGDAYVDLTIAP